MEVELGVCDKESPPLVPTGPWWGRGVLPPPRASVALGGGEWVKGPASVAGGGGVVKGPD